MYLSKEQATILHNLGFQKSYYEGEVSPFDFYSYDEEEWILGGRILPQGELLAPEKIVSRGVWLPSTQDLIYWLSDHHYTFTIECKEKGFGYKIKASKSEKEFSEKGGTLEFTLYKLIVKILEQKTAK
ncbi:hypothetical protein [Brevibacillus laterosporus]|uniref:hypothetical protein n=1 Tax=Brevibacillus laterosporus TaxID=1465 RepID=UPI000E6CE197|nr:hypothetical protein [Brevibacillus laterosporus]AYB38249.1 hypothetical protein D5F52_08170 [Brevibacillus laterosporus]MBM7111478.1 hypothetical protein [Brevibacillus laterosporus]